MLTFFLYPSSKKSHLIMKIILKATIPFVLFSLLIAQSLIAATAEVPPTKPVVERIPRAAMSVKASYDWWLPRHEAKLKESHKNADKINIVFLGDSITHHWEETGRVFWDKYYASRGALNLGFGGDRTEHLIWRLDHGALDGLNPKLVVLMIGINNFGTKEKASDTAAGIRAIIGRVEKKLPNAKVLLLGTFPGGAKPDHHWRASVKNVNQCISKFSDNKRIFYLDIGDKFIEPDGTILGSTMPDAVHPTAASYKIWAEAIEPTLRKITGEYPANIPTPQHLDWTLSWWMPRHEAKLKEARKHADKINLVFIGDSITHGWEGSDSQGWKGAGRSVWDEYYAPCGALNLGFGADKTEHLLWRIDHGALDGLSPKVVTLLVGANNIGAEQSVSETIAGVRAVVDRIKAKLPETKILLLAIFPLREKPDAPFRIQTEAVNRGISKLDDGKRVFYLDIGKKFLSTDGTISKSIMDDFVHPTTAGYKIWAEAIEPTIRRLVGECPSPDQSLVPRSVQPFKQKHDWWLPRHEAKYKEARAAADKIDYVFIGDSITHGWEKTGRAVWNEYYAPRGALNLGFSGDVTGNLIWRIDNGELDGLFPKVVTLLVGINNIASRNNAPDTVEGVCAVVERIQKKLPKTKILLLGIFPAGEKPDHRWRVPVKEANKGLASLADGNRVVYLDIGDKFLSQEGIILKSIMPDAVHPTAAGYKIWAEAIEPTLRKMTNGSLGDNPKTSTSSKEQSLLTADGYRGIWYSNEPQKDEYVYKYSGGLGTYCAKHMPLAIYAPEVDKTFFVYGGTDQENSTLLHMVSYYDHKTGQVPRPRILLDKKTVDAHDNPVMQIDRDGYIWIFSSSHGTLRPSFVSVSTKPYSIDAFKRVWTTNFSYPQPHYLPEDGFLLLHTKYDKGRALRQLTSPDGLSWSEPKKLANMGQGQYQVSSHIEKKVGTAFNYHPKGKGLNWRTNLYYMETSDFGKTWTNAAGDELQLPLTDPDNRARVLELESKKRNAYMKDITFDSKGRPIILFLSSGGWEAGPENSPRIWTTAHWNGSKWEIRGSIKSDNNYDTGALIQVDDNRWRIVGPTEPGPQKFNPGGEVALWESTDEGKSWKKLKQLTANSPYNHTYCRPVIGARDDFVSIWADGHGRRPSESRLYFTNRDGDHVWQLPVKMTGQFAKPKIVD
jgi:lysophospholipase L1-like esterase